MLSQGNNCAIVTGGARGIGAAIAKRLATEEYSVVINYRSSEDEANALVKTILSNGGEAIAVQSDVSTFPGAKNLIDSAVLQFGSIDVLINNAGDFLYKSISSISPEEWNSMLDSNLNSVFYCIKSVLPSMRRKQFGNIVNLADIRSHSPNAEPMKTPYIIAKTGVDQLTKSFAQTEAKHGIRINSVSPGYIDCGNYSEAFKMRIMKDIPCGRLGTPDEIADAVLFLLSDQAAYINGANIDVGGGA